MINEKGAANYRDVTCPEGYMFDVPRTSRENQELYHTLLRYWNVTAPAFYASESSKDGRMNVTAMETIESAPPLKAITGIPGGGLIWIDISSWQTAGCWVPGGVHGICPYREPDNTVALQEIIKVSTIGKALVFAKFCVRVNLRAMSPWIPGFCV